MNDTDETHIGALLTGLVLAALGVLFLLDALGWIAVDRALVLPVAAIALGIAIVVSALWRRDRDL